MRLCWFLPIALITIFVALTTGCLQKSNQKLIIATATNMQFAMKELTRSFAEVQQYVDTVAALNVWRSSALRENWQYRSKKALLLTLYAWCANLSLNTGRNIISLRSMALKEQFLPEIGREYFSVLILYRMCNIIFVIYLYPNIQSQSYAQAICGNEITVLKKWCSPIENLRAFYLGLAINGFPG